MNKRVIISIIILVLIICSVCFIISSSVSYRPTSFYLFPDYNILKEKTDLPMISRFDDGNTVVEWIYLSEEIRPNKFDKGNFDENITEYKLSNNNISVSVFRISAWPNRSTLSSNQDAVVEVVVIENIEMQLCYFDKSNILTIRHIFIDNDISVKVGITNTEEIDKNDFIEENKEILITIMSEYIEVLN